MSEPNTYQAAAAAFITGVSQDTQRDWRRRGFLPPISGRQGEYTVRDLCRLRLMRALVDASFPIAFAKAHASDIFIDSLQAELRGVQFPEYANGFLALIAYDDGKSYCTVIWSPADLAKALSDESFDFTGFHVIRLQQIAKDLVARGIFDHPGQRER